MRIYMDFLLTPFSFSRQMADWTDFLEQYPCTMHLGDRSGCDQLHLDLSEHFWWASAD